MSEPDDGLSYHDMLDGLAQDEKGGVLETLDVSFEDGALRLKPTAPPGPRFGERARRLALDPENRDGDLVLLYTAEVDALAAAIDADWDALASERDGWQAETLRVDNPLRDRIVALEAEAAGRREEIERATQRLSLTAGEALRASLDARPCDRGAVRFVSVAPLLAALAGIFGDIPKLEKENP